MKEFEYPITLQNFSKNVNYVLSIAHDHEKCIKHSQEIITFIGTLEPVDQKLYRQDIKNIFLLGTKMILKTIGFDNSLKSLTDYQVYTYKTCHQYLDRVLEIEPLHEEAKKMYAVIAIYLSQFDYNIRILERALKVHPTDLQLHLLLGIYYIKFDDMERAYASLKMALYLTDFELKLNPMNKEFKRFRVKCLDFLSDHHYHNLDYDTAEYFLLEALKSLHDDPYIHNKLGCIYIQMGKYDKARFHLQLGIKHNAKAYITDPKTLLSAVYTNMASLYLNENNYQNAIKCYDKALELDSNMITTYQNKLFNSHYILHTIKDPMYLFNLHKNIDKYLNVINTTYDIPYNKLKTTDKVNIGFVSGEFVCNNIVAPVSFFMNCILKYIDTEKFNVTCYSLKPGALETEFPNITWKYIPKTMREKPENFKNIIVGDKIHILFDLISHTSDSQIELFALKAAPIQISYCGYPNTSGLYNIDYHITDRYCDSDGITAGPGGIVRPSTQKYYTEKLLFMKHCFLSYTPAVDILTLDLQQPCIKNKYLTVGTFNKLNKINEKNVSVWERILVKCPNIRLGIKTKELATDSIRKNFLDLWKDKSVIDRIDILPYSKTYVPHLESYNDIDIALDTFPYSGTTTSCEALMMGVPVVTLFDSERQYHVQNVTSSLLLNSDMSEYICYSEEEYIQKVAYFAENLDELVGIKEKTRQKFLNGYVCDNTGFVKELEEKLLEIIGL